MDDYKPFSDRYYEELHSSSHGLLKDITDGLSSLIKENAYLRAENAELREENKRLRDLRDRSIKDGQAFIGKALKGFLNPDVFNAEE